MYDRTLITDNLASRQNPRDLIKGYKERFVTSPLYSGNEVRCVTSPLYSGTEVRCVTVM